MREKEMSKHTKINRVTKEKVLSKSAELEELIDDIVAKGVEHLEKANVGEEMDAPGQDKGGSGEM